MACFPQASRAAVHWDLQRTGSVQETCENIINRGTLPQPPPSFFEQLDPSSASAYTSTSSLQATRAAHAASTSGSLSSPPSSSSPDLISRYNLKARLELDEEASQSDPKGKSSVVEMQWNQDPDKREASLKERKAQMILNARKKFLEKHQEKDSAED